MRVEVISSSLSVKKPLVWGKLVTSSWVSGGNESSGILHSEGMEWNKDARLASAMLSQVCEVAAAAMSKLKDANVDICVV